MKNLIIIIGTIILGVVIVNTMILGDGANSLKSAAGEVLDKGAGMIRSIQVGED